MAQTKSEIDGARWGRAAIAAVKLVSRLDETKPGWRSATLGLDEELNKAWIELFMSVEALKKAAADEL